MLNSSVTAAENKKVVAWTTFREFVVGAAGFELATPCTPCKCATRLRYTPTRPRLYAEKMTSLEVLKSFRYLANDVHALTVLGTFIVRTTSGQF